MQQITEFPDALTAKVEQTESYIFSKSEDYTYHQWLLVC